MTTMIRAGVLMSMSVLAGCAGTEVEDDATATVLQAGKTDQGKTDQGKTDQGSMLDGVRLRVVRSGMQLRNASGAFVSVVGGLYRPSSKGFIQSSGTELWGVDGVGNSVAASTVSTRYDQNGIPYVDPISGASYPTSPIATFTAQELNPDGGLGATRTLRIVNTSLDVSPMNGPLPDGGTLYDAQNLLDTTYRNQINGSVTPNSDIRFYKVQIRSRTIKGDVWNDLCSSYGPGNKAIFMTGYFDTMGTFVEDPSYMGITCWDGTAAKCQRWGYRPWRSLTAADGSVVPLKPLWKACVRAARADYCSNGTSFTEENRPIDLSDKYNFIPKSPESSTWFDSNGRPDAFSDESAFDDSGALCVLRERLYSTTGGFEPSPTCPKHPVSIGPGQFCLGSTCLSGTIWVPTNAFDRGSINTCRVRLAASNSTRQPLVFISSFDSGCNSHTPTTTGMALAADCNCLTRAVCGQADPSPMPVGMHSWKLCCGEDDKGRLTGKWDSQCANKAADLIQRSSTLPVPLCPMDFAAF